MGENKRMTIEDPHIKASKLGKLKSDEESEEENDDFSLGKSEIIKQKQKQRYSLLATLLTEKEVEKYRNKITKEMKPSV